MKEARAKRAQGTISDAQLKEAEDREIEKVIKKQEDVGLKLATDGEFRRSWWHFDFFKGLQGVTPFTTEGGIQFHGVQTKHEGIKITSKLEIRGPSDARSFCLSQGAYARHSEDDYSGAVDAAFPSGPKSHQQGNLSDARCILRRSHRRLSRGDPAPLCCDAGCRYLQLDDTAWAMVCDPNERAQSKTRGDDPDTLPQRYARLTSAALEGKPADMAITMHSCRGNFRSTFIASGGYEFVAEQLLGHTNLDGYFLEYDSDRAGGFEPLRFFPKGKKQLVLGLVTSKSATLEKKDDIKRRIDEASKYVALDQLCLSPQCGFASTEEGNVLAEDEQWAKLRMIVELANEVWG